MEPGETEARHDVAHRQRAVLSVREQADPVAGTDVQRVREVDADHRFVACRRRAGVGEPGGRGVAAERAAGVEVELLRERVRFGEPHTCLGVSQ